MPGLFNACIRDSAYYISKTGKDIGKDRDLIGFAERLNSIDDIAG